MNGAALGLRVGLSLAAVLAVLWLLARLLRGRTAGRAGATVEVLGRQQLGRGASRAVVRVAGRAFVLGVTAAQVSLLGETDVEEAAPARAEAVPDPLAGSVLSPTTWRSAADALRERTVRRR